MKKHINIQEDARVKLQKGIDTVADIVKTTLGPCGSNVILRKAYNVPTIVNDGVSIAREVILEDPTENAGAELITSAASCTNSEVGDGTTTTCILSQEIIKWGFNLIKAHHVNPILLRESLLKFSRELVIPELEKQVEKVSDLESLQHVATISVGGNETYGKLVGEAVHKVGVEGIVNLENNQFPETTLTMIEGYKLDRGYMTPYAINDTEKYRVCYEDCLVLCCYHKLVEKEDLEPLWQWAYQSGKSILLILEDMDDSLFAALQMNLMKKVFRICPVKSPGFGFNVRDYMEDIAKLTGCQVFAEDTRKLRTFSPEDFGHAAKVVATREYTYIIRDQEFDSEDLGEYVDALRNQLKATENPHLQDSLKERISKLTAGVATISVGAKSESEQVELKLRIEDAINATRAALRGGIVSGGGAAMSHIAWTIEKPTAEQLNTTDSVALRVLAEALKAPEIQLIKNSGCDPKDFLKNQNPENFYWGFDGKEKAYRDLRAQGIIDPALVVKAAIENSISVASTVLTTQATIISEDGAE